MTGATAGSSARSAGVAAGLAGLLLVLSSPFHPNVLAGDVARLVLETRGWAAIHLATAGWVLAGWWAVVVTVGAHRRWWGRRGGAVVVAASVGAFVLVAVMLVEALAFPAMAREAPELLTFDGPLVDSVALRATLALGGGYFAGLVGVGMLLATTPGWERTGRLLAGATVGYVAIAGVFVPVAGHLATVAFGAALAWWGWRLRTMTPAGKEDADLGGGEQVVLAPPSNLVGASSSIGAGSCSMRAGGTRRPTTGRAWDGR